MNNKDMPKDEYIAFRTSEGVKETLQKVAEAEYRTLSQQCEMIVIEWLKEHGHLKSGK